MMYMKTTILKVVLCILCICIGLGVGQVVYVPDLLVTANERMFTDDRGVQVKIPDYPTAVIPSDLRVSPIIEAFGRDATAGDKMNTIMVTLKKDEKSIHDRVKVRYPMVVINMDSPSKVLEAYTKLGDIFHREDIATSIVTGSSDAISNALDKVISSGTEKKKVLYLKGVYEVPLSGSLENNILTECYTTSIWDTTTLNVLEFDETGSYANVSKEQVTEFAPDVIICKTDVIKRTIERDLPEIDAVKSKKVFSIEENNYHFEFDEYHSIPAMVWVIKKTYGLDSPDPDKFYKWYLSATKFNHKF